MMSETMIDDDACYIEAASRKYVKGEENAILIQSQSLPADEDVVDHVLGDGAWVLAWVWVTKAEAEEVLRDGTG